MHLRIAALILALAGAAQADVPKVVTDIPPVHGLVARVMDGIGAPDLVVPPGASAHSHDLRPSEAAALDGADIVVWIGAELSPWLENPIETLAADALVLTLLETEPTHLLPFRETEAFGDGHHDDDEHHHDDGHDHDHDHGAVDPHAWLDPANAQIWLHSIAELLSQIDPDNATAYRANAAAGQQEIAEAIARISAVLGDASAISYVVFHDAYQYFETRFGLSPRGAVTLGDAAAPGPSRIADMKKQFVSKGVDCFLVENNSPEPLADLVTEGTDVKRIEIDPLGTRIPFGPNHYLALLASLSDSFAACR